jgi:hypothetical protein
MKAQQKTPSLRLITNLLLALAILIILIGFLYPPWYRAGEYYFPLGYEAIIFAISIGELRSIIEYIVGLLLLLLSVVIKKMRVFLRLSGSLFLTLIVILQFLIHIAVPGAWEFEMVEFAYGFYIYMGGIFLLWFSLILYILFVYKQKVIKEILFGLIFWFFGELIIYTFYPLVI